jgi:hypothetical protein
MTHPRLLPVLVLVAAAMTAAGCHTHTGTARGPKKYSDKPPYPTFQGNTFEPSAAAYDERLGEVIVLNDKDSLLYRYAPDEDHGKVKKLHGPTIHELYPSDGKPVAKFESLTPLGGGEYLAATAFDRFNLRSPDNPWARVMTFRLPDKDKLRTSLRVAADPVDVDLSALAAAVRGAAGPGESWFKIEGITADGAATHVFFGVRQVGQRYDDPGIRDVVFVVRCPFARDARKIHAPDAVFRFTTHRLGRDEGLSDLQRAPDGSYLVLTSWEKPPERGDLSSHGGALFRIPPGALEGEPPAEANDLGSPLARFKAKAEGLALLPGGWALVVFDDDREWKKNFRGYEQFEGLFTVLKWE